jgi:hypothetical protein
MKGEENQDPDEAATAKKTNVVPATKATSDEDFPSELTAPHWSVVSFETCLASGLTYDEAVKKMKRLKAKKIAGLCIVTNEAARRIKNCE